MSVEEYTDPLKSNRMMWYIFIYKYKTKYGTTAITLCTWKFIQNIIRVQSMFFGVHRILVVSVVYIVDSVDS